MGVVARDSGSDEDPMAGRGGAKEETDRIESGIMCDDGTIGDRADLDLCRLANKIGSYKIA